MASTKRIAAGLLTGIGFVLITFGQVVLEPWASPRFHLLIAGVGVVLLSGGGLWWESRRHVDGEYDDREMAIRYRSGWLAFWVLTATAFGLGSVELFSTWRLPPGGTNLLGAGGIALMVAGHFLLKRRR